MLKKKQTRPLELQVSEKNVSIRVIVVVLLLAIGVGFLAYFVNALITKEPGWYTIEIKDGNAEINGELIFNYNIGQTDMAATDEYKTISALYADEAVRAFRLFDIHRGYEGVVNLYHINRNPGQVLTVDPILYNAFSMAEAAESRILYMAPIYSEYRNLFYSQNEIEAASYDPYRNADAKTYMAEVTTFTADPDMVRVELLGNNQIKLVNAEEYRAFLDEYEITEYIDFAWLANAFIVDHVADVMISRGFTNGNITSFDGYTRNFDQSGERYAFNIFDRDGEDVYPAGIAQYQNAISVVFLRDYPMSTQDLTGFYRYPDGDYVTRYADPATGLYKSAIHNLVSYSHDSGCGEIALSMAEVFIADTFDEGKLERMREKEIFSIWCQDRTVYYNDKTILVSSLYSDENIAYEAVLRESED